MSERYQIQEKLGQGGVGAVYKAFDTQLKREVALKRVLTPDEASAEEVAAAADNLMKEATTLSKLNHPNIITVYDVDRDEQGGFVVMELLKGKTLDDVIADSLLTLPDFEEVVNQTLEGLIAAQAEDMMHRDLKPGNVMLNWRPSGKFQVKILDFGLAKVSKSPAEQTLDQGDAILGSIFFMAPEQFERAPLTFSTDMYAMGAIYYFTLTGKYPFTGETPPQVMAAHLQHNVVNLKDVRPDLPDAVCQWVMWLINRDPRSRPQSAREALSLFPDTTPTATFVAPVAAVTPVPGPAAPTTQPVRTVPPVATAATAATATTSTQPRMPATKIPATGTGPQPAAGPTTGRIPTVTQRQTGSFAGAVAGTTGSQELSPAAAARIQAEKAAAKKRMRTVIIGTSISAALLLIGGLIFLSGKMNSAKQRDRVEQLDTENPEGTVDDVNLLIRFLSSDPRKSDPRALGILTSLEGPGVEEAIVQQLGKADPGSARLALIQVVANRRIKEAFDEVLATFKTASGTERSASAETLKRISSPGQETQLVPLLKGTLKAQDRSMLEDAVTTLTRQNASVATRSDFLLDEMNSATGEYRKSIARILGYIGGEKALARLSRVFRGGVKGDSTYQYDVLLALQNWPDRSAVPLMEELITSNDRALKTAATRSYIRMIGLPDASADDTKLWQKAFDTATRSDIPRIFGAMVDRPTATTLGYLKNTKIEGLEPTFKKLITEVEKGAQVAIPVVPGEVIPASRSKLRGQADGSYDDDAGYTVWKSPQTWLQWTLKFNQPGTYEVKVHSSAPTNAGSKFQVLCAGNRIMGQSVKTASADAFQPAKLTAPAVIKIDEATKGVQVLYLQGGDVVTGDLIMNVKGIEFTKK